MAEKSTPSMPTTSFMDGLYNIGKFSGDDKTYSSSKWAQDIEDNAEIFGWNSQQTLIIARRTLSGTAEIWLRSEKTFRNYEELKAALMKEFPEAVNCKEMHEIMAARKKRKDETFYQYMLTMKELGKRAKFPDYVAIQYIIDGIEDHEANKTVLYGVTSYAVLKEKLAIYEKIKKKCMEERKMKNTIKSDGVHKWARATRCYNCGEFNHRSAECPRKNSGLKCFKCNEYGHIASSCEKNGGPTSYNLQQNRFGRDRPNFGNFRRNQYGNQSAEVIRPTNSQPHSDVPKSVMFTTSILKGSDDSEGSIECDVSAGKMASVKSTEMSIKLVSNGGLSGINKPIVTILISKMPIDALLDTGSDVNLLCEDVYREISSEYNIVNERMTLTGLGKQIVLSLGKCVVPIIIDNKEISVTFNVIPSSLMSCYKVILGQEFLTNYTVVFSEKSVHLLNKGENWIRNISCVACVDQLVSGDCSPDVREEVIQCVKSYQPNQIKEVPLELKIILKDDIPVAHRPRRISFKEQAMVENQVTEWLEKNIIRVSYSEYASPVVLVRKKDGSMRVCIDYRDINKKIIKDEYPLPIIEDLIDKLVDAKFFSVLDLENGFFHLKVSEDSIKYTAFVTHHGQFEFLRAPFGLSICPKYFTRFISIIFRDLISKGLMATFIDDIIVYADDELQAVQRFKHVLKVASEYGLQINWKKANLITRKVEYLGHIIEDGKVRPSSDKTDAVLRYPEPRTIKQLHSFIGLTSYFRKYIQDYALIAKPLTDLLRKDIKFKFEEDERKAFNILKQKLASKPVLSLFNPRLSTELHTDASSVAYAAILMQKTSSGELHPIHYMSKRTKDTESKYSSYELEALAVIEGVKKFHHYLFGVKFKIVTDCQAFKMTLMKKDLTPRVARWVLLLDQYEFEIEHRSGSRMRHTDALSRNPITVATVINLHDQIQRAQDTDEGLKAIKDILCEKSYCDYTLENGLLYKGMDKRLVIPKSMELEVIRRVHERGHFSKRKMVELIGKDYYIRNLDTKIEDFLVTCIPCLLATKKEGRQEGFLNSIDKHKIPLHTLHCDHIGPLTATRKLYNYIFTVVDGFSKFVWIFPTKGTTSEETINKLRIHQQTFGNPVRFITDKGTAFTSSEFKEYCDKERIEHITITTGVPRGNGQVERINRIIISVLTKLCVSDQSLWYKHVSRLQQALNSTFQRSVNTTPFELMMGTKMRTKEDIEIYSLLQQECLDDFVQQREELRLSARKQIERVQNENARNYNRKRKESYKYKEGDRVAIKRTQFGSGLKLKEKFLGPYLVTEVKGNDRYGVEKIDSSREGPIKTSCSADHMKPWPEFMDDELDN